MPQSGHSPEIAMILGNGVFIVTLELELSLGWNSYMELPLESGTEADQPAPFLQWENGS